MHLQDRLIRHLDVLRRCLSDLRLRHLLDICKTSWQDVVLCLGKTSLRHLVDVFLLTGHNVCATYSFSQRKLCRPLVPLVEKFSMCSEVTSVDLSCALSNILRII